MGPSQKGRTVRPGGGGEERRTRGERRSRQAAAGAAQEFFRRRNFHLFPDAGCKYCSGRAWKFEGCARTSRLKTPTPVLSPGRAHTRPQAAVQRFQFSKIQAGAYNVPSFSTSLIVGVRFAVFRFPIIPIRYCLNSSRYQIFARVHATYAFPSIPTLDVIHSDLYKTNGCIHARVSSTPLTPPGTMATLLIYMYYCTYALHCTIICTRPSASTCACTCT